MEGVRTVTPSWLGVRCWVRGKHGRLQAAETTVRHRASQLPGHHGWRWNHQRLVSWNCQQAVFEFPDPVMGRGAPLHIWVNVSRKSTSASDRGRGRGAMWNAQSICSSSPAALRRNE
jgi:hypothetical protein